MINKCKLILLTLLSMVLFFQLGAQNSDTAKEVTSTYLLKNANVVQQPGKVLANTSVLIRDGLIVEVSKNIKPPFDAQVINADSMYIYAAFIDAATHVGIPKPEKEDRPDVKDPGNPPLDIAGVTPQHTAADQIAYGDKSIEDMRKAGFGYLHVMPRGQMLPGTGTIITTGEGSREELLLRDETAFFSQLVSARGVFPNTIIGVMSKYRDVYKNAELSLQNRTAYTKNPKGVQRPSMQKEYLAMEPLVTKEMPVFFAAQKVKDIYRVLTLQEELGFDLVLTDIRQGNRILADIQSKNIPVVLSMELPKKIEDKKKDDKKKDEKAEADKESAKKEDKKEVVDEAKQAFDERKKQAYDTYEAQASDFVKAGVPIAFSTLSVKAKEVKPNIERMIAKGLTADAALAALTTQAAATLGISDVAGTIEKGKLANIIVSDKPYFEEKAKIKYSVNDGKLYTYEAEKKKKASDGEAGDITGTWSYTLEIPGDETNGTMIIAKDGEEYSIKIDSSDEPGDYEDAFDVELDDNELTFGLSVDNDGYMLNIVGTLTIDGDEFEGTLTIADLGAFPIAGSRTTPK